MLDGTQVSGTQLSHQYDYVLFSRTALSTIQTQASTVRNCAAGTTRRAGRICRGNLGCGEGMDVRARVANWQLKHFKAIIVLGKRQGQSSRIICNQLSSIHVFTQNERDSVEHYKK